MKQTTPKKTASRRGRKPKEATASDNCRMCIVLKHSLPEILNWMDNNRKHFYCAAEKGKDVANVG